MKQQPKAGAVWFEIPCADLDRAAQFYETILGRSMKKNVHPHKNMCIFPSEPGGVTGALVKRAFQKPGRAGTIVYLSCDGEIDAVISRVSSAGGLILMPRTDIPGGYGSFACLKDSEGNHVGLHSAF